MLIYLAGGRSTEWRAEVTSAAAIYGHETYDPFKDSRQNAIYEYVQDDLNGVRMSGLVFGVVDYPRYTGLAAEFGFARALGIPSILVWDAEKLTNSRVDGFVAALSYSLFFNVKDALDFLRERDWLTHLHRA